MTDRNVDKHIEDALMEGTEEMSKVKNEVWGNIEKSLYTNKNTMTRASKRVKKKPTKKIIVAAAVIAFIAVFSNSRPGIEAIGKVKEMLVPEKKIVIPIEGMEEEQDVALKESAVGYSIYFDDSYYNLEKLEGKDKITPKNKPTDTSLPEMYMEISQIKDKAPSAIASEVEEELKANFTNLLDNSSVNSPIKAIRFSATTGLKWNDTVVVYYIIDNTAGGSFVIKQQYFIEASEGMGARFENMLREFRITKQ